MDLTNRVLAVGVSLLGIFVVLVVILLAWGAPDESIGRIADLAGYLDDHNSTGAKLIVTFGGLIFVLLATIVIILEVAPPETGSVKVVKVGSGNASIGTDEIGQRLEEELRAVPQLAGVQATVVSRGRKAEVQLDLYVSSDADLTTTTEEACRRARELVEQRMGVELDCQPKARLHYRELQVARPPASASSPFGQSSAPARTGAAPASSTVQQPSSGMSPVAPSAGAGSPGLTASPHEAGETSQEDRPAGA